MLDLKPQNDAVYDDTRISRSELNSYSSNYQTSSVITSERECLPFPEMEFNFDDLEEILSTD